MFWWLHRALTAALRMLDEPLHDEVVQLTQRLPCVPEVEITRPARCLLVDRGDQPLRINRDAKSLRGKPDKARKPRKP